MSPFANGPALLFCPADRPERWQKAIDRSDAAIIDLEDAVLPAARPAARAALVEADPDPARVIIRVNPVGTEDFDADIRAVLQTRVRHIMLAKTESAAQVDACGELRVLALIETARGVVAAEEIAAHPSVDALMWGAEDLIASLGGSGSRNAAGAYRDIARSARSRVLMAAGAFGKIAVDAVHLDIADATGLANECEDGAASGFSATACIHPSQVEVVRAAYRPTEAEVEWANAVLEAAAGKNGVFSFNGAMVDEPVLRHARSILSREA